MQGPVYMKAPLSLEGRADDIYLRASNLAADMIARIIEERPVPESQKGRGRVFPSSNASESRIPERLSPDELEPTSSACSTPRVIRRVF